MSEQAALWGIETDYVDAFGHRQSSDPDAVARMVDILSQGGDRLPGSSPQTFVPKRAFQGGEKDPRRVWALAVQLYGVRSRRNWGHGDFTDLAALVDLASDLGAAGIALNPLHALFDDPADASPYSPNSRRSSTRAISMSKPSLNFPGCRPKWSTRLRRCGGQMSSTMAA